MYPKVLTPVVKIYENAIETKVRCEKVLDCLSNFVTCRGLCWYFGIAQSNIRKQTYKNRPNKRSIGGLNSMLDLSCCTISSLIR